MFSGDGTLFRISPEGSFTTLKVLTGSEARNPAGGMILGRDGNFYGIASQGGLKLAGVAFKLTPEGGFTTVAHLQLGNGMSSRVGLLEGLDGNFYGVRGASAPEIDSGHPGSVFRITLAGALSTFADFAARDGKELQAGLVEGNDGILYGATYRGGRHNQGTVYQVTPGGLLTTLVHFDGQNGSAPGYALIRGSDGNLYGTTAGGGLSNRGTVFRMTPAGALSTLISFDDTNGNFPRGRLVEGGDGFLYGSTLYGGSGFEGTVFRIGLQGTLTTLVNFNGANGSGPAAELVPGSGGNFYGTTPSGGTSDMGTVFRMTRSGALTTLVHFTGSNGRSPEAGLVQGRDGNFYGATTSGGFHGWGTFFRMSPAGSLTTLVNLSSVDLGTPPATLIQGMDGNFYGTAPGNVFAGRFGVVFRMTPEGGLTTVHEFNNSFGRYPYSAGLIQASDGNLYGTTTAGGITSDGKPAGGGQIYRLRLVPLPVPDIGVEAPSGTGLVLGAASVGFGSITVGASSAVEFTLRNSGTAELTELAVTIDGMDAGDFTAVGSPAASLPGPGGNTVFSVRFSPLGDGPRTAVLRIGSNDPDEGGFVIALSGTGVPAVPEISIMQPVGSDLRDGGAKKSFGTVKLGKRGPSKVFTIVNRGTARLTGLSISKKGGQKTSFEVTPPALTSLTPGESTAFKVRFKPTVKGTCNTAIHIQSNDSDESPFEIRISGSGASR